MTTITSQYVLTTSTTITLAADDILDVSGDAAILWDGTGASATFVIDNYGMITDQSDNALTIGDTAANAVGTLTFNNHVGGTVDGELDLRDLTAAATVIINNDGLMSGGNARAIRFATDGASVTLNNSATGVITHGDPSSDVLKDGSNVTINNHGKIFSAADKHDADGNVVYGGDAIDFGDGSNNAVHNYDGGSIEGSHHGITGDIGATIINDAGAVIRGRNGSGLNFDNDADVANALVVTNRGTILGESANYDDSDGDGIDTDGLLTLDNYGFVGGMGANGEHDGGTNHAEAIAAGGGTINNYKGGMIFSVERAIQIDDSAEGDALAATTIYNEGVIQATSGEAINIIGTFGDTLTNKGTIIGDIFMGDGDDTVTFSKGSNVIGAVDLGDGDDTFKGSNADESIYGGLGSDTMTGGAGADTFFFTEGSTAKSKAAADMIVDFSGKAGDILDLSAIDAKDSTGADDAFKFIGSQDFHKKAGELRFETTKHDTYIYGDTDGDGKADFAIHLDATVALKAGYFEL